MRAIMLPGRGRRLALAASSLLTLCLLAGQAAPAQQPELGAGQAAQAQEPAAAPAQGGAPGAPSDLESDFFGAGQGSLPEEEKPGLKDAYTEELLKREGTRIGGDFEFKMTAGAGYRRDFSGWSWPYLSDHAVEASELKLDGSLFFSARPSDRVRYYGKAKASYPFATKAASAPGSVGSEVAVPEIGVWELFTDVELDHRVFIRAGKQMVKWGVGYFFQPADIISLTPVDVNDPTAEREGPVALKLNFPLGVNNLDLYAIAPSSETIDSVKQIGLAGRGQLVVGGFELGLGAAYQKTEDLQFVGTASGSVWKIGVFGEGALKRTSLVNFIGPAGLVEPSRHSWFFDGTAGIEYFDTDSYWSLIAQYYYNGEGYADARKLAAFVPALIAPPSPSIGVGDIAGFTGRHYIALDLAWSFRKDSEVKIGMLLISNFSDGSGTVSPYLDFDLSDDIVLELRTTLNYGQDGSQFRGIAGSYLGEALVLPVASVQASLSIGTGKF